MRQFFKTLFALAFSILIIGVSGATAWAQLAPEIKVDGANSLEVVSGDTTPRTLDGTDFGLQTVGTTTSSTTFFISNNFGTATLSLGTVTITGANAGDFSIAFTYPPGTTVPVGNTSADVIITFDPLANGLRTATVNIPNNDPDENPYTFAIQGTGQGAAAVPEINVTGSGNTIVNGDTTPSVADRTDFGTLTVGDTPQNRGLVIENLGAGTLNLGANSVSISGPDAGDFSVFTQPLTTVNAGGTRTFTLRFDPQSAGLKSATVSINNDDADENPYTFSIQGTGNAPEMKVDGDASLEIISGDTTPSTTDGTDFGTIGIGVQSLEQIFFISNAFGTASLNLGTVSISGAHAGDFSITTIPSSSVAIGAATTNLGIKFTPATAGLRTATVSIPNNDVDENPYTFSIQGTGSDNPEIKVDGAGSLEVVSGDTTPSTTDGTDFGLVANGGMSPDTTFFISNTFGIAPLTLGTVTLIGANPGDFVISAQPSSPVAVGGDTTTLIVKFAPTTTGLRTATVNIPNNDADENPYTFAIQGTGTAAAPRIASVTRQNPTVQNTSADTLTWRVTFDVPVQNVDAGLGGDFIVAGVTNGTVSVVSVSTSVYDVTISGGDLAGLNDTVTFFINNTTQDITDLAGNALVNLSPTGANDNDFNVSNTAPVPEINITGNGQNILTGDTTPQVADNTDFGSHDVAGGQQANTFTVFSAGTAQLDLNVGGVPVVLSGANAGDFSIDSQPAQFMGTGTNSSFSIRFNPTALGLRTATITIANNDPDENPFTFTVQGTGTDLTAPRIASIDTLFVGSPTDSDEIIWRILFSETVLNVTLDDFALSGTTAPLSVRTPVTDNPGFGTLIDLRAIGGDLAELNGNITLSLAGTQNITDVSGNALTNTAPTGLDDRIVQIINVDPDIRVTGNGTNPVANSGPDLVNGQTATSAADGTDFGNHVVGVQSDRFFYSVGNTIQFSTLIADVSQAIMSGPAAADFTVTGSNNLTLPGLGTSGFTMRFTPSALGARNATVTIVSNDPDENPFTFNVTGTGIAGPATTLVATSGTPQSQTINAGFSNPVVATITDAGGNPVSGVTVNFAAPGAGASATLSAPSAVTDANGQASVTATANGTAGSYSVTASATGLTDVTFALTNTVGAATTLAITSGTPQSQTEGLAFADPLVVTITDASGNPVSGVSVGFGAPASGASATLSAATATTDASGQASVTATANNTAGSYSVTASATGLTSGTFALTNISADTTPPTISFTGVPSVTNGSTAFTITGTFSETITGFTVSDISVTNGAASDLAVTGLNFTAKITPDGNGDVGVSIAANVVQDAAGNGNTATAGQTASLDNAAPTLAITLPSGTSTGPVTATFTFSEAVSGFVLGDISVSGGSASNLLATGNGGTSFTATITPNAGTQGDVTVSVVAGAYTDQIGNQNTAASSATLNVDNQAPTVTLSNVASEVIADFGVTATFGEDVTGFTVSDITVSNANVSGFTAIDGMNYSFTITPLQLGTVTVDVAANVAADAAGNGNTALANRLTTEFTIDRNAIRIRTQAIIYNFLAQRADQLTAAEPDLSRRLQNTGTQGRLNGNAEIGNVRLAFNGTASGEDLNLAGAFGADKAAKISTWLQAGLSAVDNDNGSDADLFLLHGGVDYRLNEDVVIGLMAQYDYTNLERMATPSDSGFDASGKGWLVGPYVVARLKDNLVFDGRIAWGQSDNEVSPSGTYIDKFNTNRWLLKGQLSGEMGNLAGWAVAPELALMYFQDKQSGFTDSNGININAQTVDLGRLSFGPRFSRKITMSESLTLHPELSVRGIWDFDTPGEMDLLSGIITKNDRFRARSQAGLRLDFMSGTSVGFNGFYDGIGAENFNAYGGFIQIDVTY